MKSPKQLIRTLIHSTGYDLHRLKPESNPSFQLLQGMQKFGIDLVLDVGANTGQFAIALRSVGFKGHIVSFEPLQHAHAQLMRNAASDGKWSVHSRCAVGDRDGQVEINVSANSVSSSVLPMTEAHSSAASGSAYVGSEKVPIFRLDSVSVGYLAHSESPFLKIDAQGFEWAVLNGAATTLSAVRGVLCELSLVTLYHGQHLWLDMLRRLEAEGLTLWSLQNGFTDPRDGRTLQVDAILFRA